MAFALRRFPTAPIGANLGTVRGTQAQIKMKFIVEYRSVRDLLGKTTISSCVRNHNSVRVEMRGLSEQDSSATADVANPIAESRWTRFKRLSDNAVVLNLTLPRPRALFRRSTSSSITDSSYGTASRDADPTTFTKKITISLPMILLAWLLFFGWSLTGETFETSSKSTSMAESTSPALASAWWTKQQGGTKCPSQPKPLSRGREWEVQDGYDQLIAGRLSKAVQIPVSGHESTRSPEASDGSLLVSDVFFSFRADM